MSGVEKISSQRLGSRVDPEYADERKEVVRATRQLVRPDLNSETGHPQASRKLVPENQNQTESDERECCDSTSSRKPAASSPELTIVEYTKINTWAISFSVCARSWKCPQLTQHSHWKHTETNGLIWECLWLRRWKPPFILGRISSRIRKSTRTQNSRILRVSSTSLKLVREHYEEIFNLKCLEYSSPSWARPVLAQIKRSNGQRQKYVSTLIPFYVLDRWKTLQERIEKMERTNGRTEVVLVLPWWRSN